MPDDANAMNVLDQQEPLGKQEAHLSFEISESGSQHVFLRMPDDDASDSSSGITTPSALFEDLTMSTTFTYVDFLKEDLEWSALSNSFFFVGGISYLALSCLWMFEDSLAYVLLDFVAPLVYLFNSIVDISWAKRVRERKLCRRQLKKSFERADSISSLSVDCRCHGDVPVERGKIWRNLKRLHRHAAHRRALFAAATFGIAALFGSVEVYLRYRYGEDTARIANFCSLNTYILSSIIAITGKRTQPITIFNMSLQDPDHLEDLGDILFLIGSLLDGLWLDLGLDRGQASLVVQNIEAIVSSVLWLLDSCFYFHSDKVRAERAKSAPEHANLV